MTMTPYRRMESEADEIGLTLAARACYKPGAAVSVYQILGSEEAKHGGDHMPAMLRTHPMSSDRIKSVCSSACMTVLLRYPV